MSKIKEPKDLGVKIVPEEQVVWENVKKEAEYLIKQSKNNLMIQNELLKVAETKIQTFKDL